MVWLSDCSSSSSWWTCDNALKYPSPSVVWSQVALDRLYLRMCVFCGDWVTCSNLCPLGTFRSEANDLALRLAWQYTGHKDIITLEKWVLLFRQQCQSVVKSRIIRASLTVVTHVLCLAARTTATSRRSSTSALTSTTSCLVVRTTHPCMWWVLFPALLPRHTIKTPWLTLFLSEQVWLVCEWQSPTAGWHAHACVWLCHLSGHSGLILIKVAGRGYLW